MGQAKIMASKCDTELNLAQQMLNFFVSIWEKHMEPLFLTCSQVIKEMIKYAVAKEKKMVIEIGNWIFSYLSSE